MVKIGGVSYNIKTGELKTGEIDLWTKEDAMAKRIADYEVLVSVNELTSTKTGTVRYHIDDTENPQIHIYDHFSQTITGTDTVDTLLTNIENAIKTKEGIS